MGQHARLKIGILFNVSRNWLGGVYYIVNLIKALDALDDSEKPELVVLYTDELKEYTRELTYSRLSLQPWRFDSPVSGYLKSWLTGRNVFSNEIVNRFDLDGIYPEWNQPLPVKKAYDRGVKSVSWFADLQHKYYPEFFSRKQLVLRELRLKLLLKHTDDLVVSSKAAAHDFKRFYPVREDLEIHVLNFVSIIDAFDFESKATLCERYGLSERYYLISNQFHKHKNHQVVLKALAELKRRGSPLQFVFTGKMPDDEGSEYTRTLKHLIDKHDLMRYVRFLGVIPRHDQLGIMKHSAAVIQPSLFEGWSTVVEDAKSLQVPVIASDLDVHIEQLGEAGTYFDPHDEKKLADILFGESSNNGQSLYDDYQCRVQTFAKDFIRIFR